MNREQWIAWQQMRRVRDELDPDRLLGIARLMASRLREIPNVPGEGFVLSFEDRCDANLVASALAALGADLLAERSREN